MASGSTMSSMERDGCTICIGGKTYTMAAYRQMLREKKQAEGKTTKTKRKKKAAPKEVSMMAEEVEKLIKPLSVLKSVQVYRNHAYRSWGTIANEILSYKGISKPMAMYCVRFGELNTLVADIQHMAKRNEKAIYQYIEKVAWKLDDMKTNIIEMIRAANESEVCQRFKDHEAIYGKGRQLGLATVIEKCLKAIGQLEDVIKELKKIAENGTDPFNYGNHMSAKARARCWA